MFRRDSAVVRGGESDLPLIVDLCINKTECQTRIFNFDNFFVDIVYFVYTVDNTGSVNQSGCVLSELNERKSIAGLLF